MLMFEETLVLRLLDSNVMIYFKVRLSPTKNICVICLIESPLTMMKNAFYYALFVLKLFKFLSRLFGHVGKTA